MLLKISGVFKYVGSSDEVRRRLGSMRAAVINIWVYLEKRPSDAEVEKQHERHQLASASDMLVMDLEVSANLHTEGFAASCELDFPRCRRDQRFRVLVDITLIDAEHSRWTGFSGSATQFLVQRGSF
jgi:hypothetical protein